MHRKDKKKGGGGLIAYVFSTIASKTVKTPTFKHIEVLAIEMKINNKDLLLTGAHRPPNGARDSTVIWVKNCRSKKGLKQCLGGLKCSQNTKKNKKTLKVSFKAIFNVHFANLGYKEYFSIQRLIIFLLYE